MGENSGVALESVQKKANMSLELIVGLIFRLYVLSTKFYNFRKVIII